MAGDATGLSIMDLNCSLWPDLVPLNIEETGDGQFLIDLRRTKTM